MYRIIIVDDEKLIHKMLKDYIENIIGEFEVVACLKNGAEAIEFIEKNKVDIVITDIKMPKVSGIELAKYIHENMLAIKVIIMSGYSEFEYAKKAIMYNVSDYLLKAIDMNELTQVLRRVASELNSGKEESSIDIVTQREGFCTDLFAGVLSDEEIKSEYGKCNIPYDINDVKVAAFKCELLNCYELFNEKWNYDFEYFYNAVKGILQSIINESIGGIVVEISKTKDCIVIILMTDFIMSGIETKFTDTLFEIMGLKCNINKIIDFCGMYEIKDHTNIFSRDEMYTIMISCIKIYGKDHAESIISHVVNLLNYENSKGESNNDVDGSMIEDIISAEYRCKKEGIIDVAKKYIEENYMNDISYIDIADELHFNPMYFSRFFKQMTGKTVGEQLLEVRIKKVIEYLNTNKKVSEISELCGYKNTRTFQRVFKNYTGYSALDYKKYVLNAKV